MSAAATYPATDQAVVVEGLSYLVGNRRILDNINLTIEHGRITGLLGPNGAGKTTLISMMTGLLLPSSGTISVFGRAGPLPTAWRKKIGVVLQETALYDELTVFENLRFAANLYSVPNGNARSEEVLDLLGLGERRDDQVRILSGGLRRRVAIARALLHKPDLLVVDEPTLGVDATARHAIWEHLRLLRSMEATVIVASNYLDEVQALCDVVSVLNHGKVVLTEPPEQLIARAGWCLEIACQAESAGRIAAGLRSNQQIHRLQTTPTGLSIFVETTAVAETILHEVHPLAPIEGFRVRSPDLAEIFEAVSQPI